MLRAWVFPLRVDLLIRFRSFSIPAEAEAQAETQQHKKQQRDVAALRKSLLLTPRGGGAATPNRWEKRAPSSMLRSTSFFPTDLFPAEGSAATGAGGMSGGGARWCRHQSQRRHAAVSSACSAGTERLLAQATCGVVGAGAISCRSSAAAQQKRAALRAPLRSVYSTSSASMRERVSLFVAQ